MADRAATGVEPRQPLILLSSLAQGGAERVTVSFGCELARRGLPVTVCTLTDRHDGALADELAHAGVRRVDLGGRRLADPRLVPRYLRLLSRHSIDLVHAHGQDAWILGAAARRLGHTPLVLTRHVLDEPDTNWREALRRRNALWAARCADRLVTPSSAASDRLAELTGIDPSRIAVVPNGIDLSNFDRPDLDRRRGELRHALDVEPGEPLVLVPAMLRRGKGHDVLLAAMPAVLQSAPRVRVLFAGSGEAGDALRRLAAPLGRSVTFLGSRSDMPELYAACDLVVLASDAEVQPVSLIEAAAAGRPVVATRVGGTPDVVIDGLTGVLVPPGDPEMLARAIVSVLADPHRAAAKGEAARRHVQPRFSMSSFVDETLGIWRDAIDHVEALRT
jgi:glycosyltransferase involved in cell wall biosynthesis